MDMYGQIDKSVPQKTVLVLFELAIIFLSYWILFMNGFNKIFPSNIDLGNNMRYVVIFSFNVIVFFRMFLTMFLLTRKIPWEEVFSIPFAFGLYFVGYALFVYRTDLKIDIIDYFAIFLFLLGSFLNTFSELQRRKWKKNPQNKGHLYMIGLFKYSMHINYFGDLLWVIAYALITRNWFSFSIPIFLFLFFAFYNIPKLDKYLAYKYKDEFVVYKQKTKSFIPFIY